MHTSDISPRLVTERAVLPKFLRNRQRWRYYRQLDIWGRRRPHTIQVLEGNLAWLLTSPRALRPPLSRPCSKLDESASVPRSSVRGSEGRQQTLKPRPD